MKSAEAVKSSEIEALKKELTESKREHLQFMHAASHDLQEPVRVISMYLEVLEYKKKKGDELTVQDYQEACKVIYDSALHAQRLIESLLHLSRASSRDLDLKRFNFESVLHKSLHALKAEIEKSGAQVVIENVSVELEADEGLVERVLHHLISNAIEYRNGRPLKIEISSVCKGGERIFCVRDNGMGIDPEYSETIFEPFKRLNRNKLTSGMGLTVCKKILERHGGRIWMESRKGQGSAFYFSFPSTESL